MPRAKDDDDLPGEEVSATTRRAAKKTPPKAAPEAEEDNAELEALEGKAPPKPVHSSRLLALAGRCKIPQHEIDSLTSEELMAEVQFEMARIQDDMARKSAEPPPAAPAKPAAAELDPEDEIDQLVKDGAITEQVARIMRAPFKENKALKEKVAKLDDLEARETARTNKTLDDHVDAAFAAIEDRYGKHFGTGDFAGLKEGTDDYNRRVAAFRMAGIDPKVDTGRTIQRKIAGVAKMLYGDGVAGASAPEPKSVGGGPSAAAVPNKPARKTRDEEWADATLAKPSNRNGSPEVKGVQAAKEAVAKSMKDRGIDPGYISLHGEDDDLPGGPD